MVVKTARPIDSAFIIKAVRDKLIENHRLQRLQNYYEGKHDILLRQYDDPTKPNNRIVANYCKNITDFLTAYLVGVPIKFEGPQVILDSLNYNDNADTTQSIVLNMNIMGLGCELFYTDADGIPRFASIDPRESIFVTDDSVEELLTSFIRIYPESGETESYNVTVYTANDFTQYKLSLSFGELKAVGPPQPHYFNDVPAIMYPNNNEYIGTFEGVIPLQDALNKLISDEINDFESFVDAYLVLEGIQGTTAADINAMKQNRVLLLDGTAKAYWLVKEVNNEHIRELKDGITAKIRELGSIPDIKEIGSFGASGVALKFKLIPTEIQASKQERVLQRGIQRKLELLYNIFKITDPSIGTYTDVKVEFERNFIMLSDDKLKEAEADLDLVREEVLSRKSYLIKHKDLTPDEADEELRDVSIEQFRVDENTFPMDTGEELDE